MHRAQPSIEPAHTAGFSDRRVTVIITRPVLSSARYISTCRLQTRNVQGARQNEIASTQ
jgi:hypothetical protein